MSLPISITDAAVDRLKFVAGAEKVNLDETYLRVAVIQGGCSGLTYDLGWDSNKSDADSEWDLSGIKVLLDNRSKAYVEGTVLDFTDGLDGKGFHFANPQAARTCACGESFGL